MAGVMMGPPPEPQPVLEKASDPLQWLWDGVADFQSKIEDLRTRAERNFRLTFDPADVARHDDDCGLKKSMPCSCCKGALTFEEAKVVKGKLTGVCADPNTKPRRFDAVPATTCWGVENCRELFGLRSDKEALSAAFEAGSGHNDKNLLFGSSGIVSRTLDHWKDLLEDAFKLIDNLRAELFKSRAETQKALAEKDKAEGDRLYAALKLDQTQARLDDAQKALDAMAKDRRARALQDAFDAAEGIPGMRAAKKHIIAKLLSLSLGKTPMERLKARRTPRHPTGLTRSPSRAVNRAARMHEERKAGRGIETTDSGGLHRTTCARRRNITLPLLNEFVASAGPVHLPRVPCPPESDTKAHNDYKAKVCVCARAPARARARVLTRWECR